MTRDEMIEALQKIEHNCNINIVIGDEDDDLLSFWEFEFFLDKSEDGYTELYCQYDKSPIKGVYR